MNIEKILYSTEEELAQTKTLIIGLLAIITMLTVINQLVIEFANFVGFKIRPLLYSFLIISWIGYWIYNRYYLPRNKDHKSNIGIVIAIHSENENERKKLKLDFVSKLKKDLQSEGLLNFSNVIFFKNHFSQQINESKNPRSEIERINKKVKAHFYIWGNVKKRPDGDDEEKYFINFHGYVAHKPIPKNISNEISRDFSKVLPRQVQFLEKGNFKGFEASAKIVHLAAQYIIGLAAFVSYDPQLAFKLHDGLKEKFNAFKPLPKHLQEIRNRIPKLISDEALWISKWHFNESRINETKKFLKKSLEENPNNYGSWLFKAVVDFLVDNNPNEALKSIKKSSRYAKNTFEWRYSEAFLHFWLENYSKALRICQKIKNQSYLNEKITLLEVRQFNQNLLERNNFKIQLYFWMGYLAYFKEKNLGNALQDFEKFEQLAKGNMHDLKQRSSAYLTDIKKQMGIKK